MSKWQKDNTDKLNAAKVLPLLTPELMLGEHTTICIPMGLIVWNKPEFRKLNGDLWDSYLEELIKNGFMPYMTGLRYSRALIRAGAFSEQFYNFLRNIKQTLDPQGILSPGKYCLGIYGE
jgi:FAD/FMN-containing dehydrogenase